MSGFPDPFYQHPPFYPVTPTPEHDSPAGGHDPHADSLGPSSSLLDYSQQSSGGPGGPYVLGQFQEVYGQSLQDPDFFRVRSGGGGAGALLTAQQQQQQQQRQNQQSGYSIRGNPDDLSNNVYNAWSGVDVAAAGNVFPYDISDAYSMPSLASQHMYSTFPPTQSVQNYWDVAFQNTSQEQQTLSQEQYSQSHPSVQPRAIQPKPQAQVPGQSAYNFLQRANP